MTRARAALEATRATLLEAPPATAPCATCGADVRVRVGGELRAHGRTVAYGMRTTCEGSGLPVGSPHPGRR